MIQKTPPENFNPKFEVAGCHIDCKGKLLMLHRADHKSAGNKWGVPAGKIEPGETFVETAQREVFEETGLRIPAEKIKFHTTTYVSHLGYELLYHIVQTELEEEMMVILNEEHKDFRWMTPQEALALGDDLVPDEDFCIRLVYDMEMERKECEPQIKIPKL